MQTDGNLVVYSPGGAPLWNSGTNGTNSERLEMEDDGRILIYKSAWNSGTVQPPSSQTLPPPACNVGPGIGTTGTLSAGQCIVSFNGLYELLLQADGNLVLYKLAATPAPSLWSTNTALTPFSPSVALTTLYAYDVLGNLTCVEQHGDAANGTGCGASAAADATSPWRVRRFTYDSLSRLLTAHNPESGTISYVYDADGSLISKTSPQANQNGTATQTVSFCYDALHRLTKRDYIAHTYVPPACPITTPVVSYVYDVGTNGIGRMTSLTDQAGSGSYSYDNLGRVSSEQRTIAGVSKTVSYEYNLDSSAKALHYPSQRVVNYTYNSAGQPLTAIDGNSTQYVGSATYYSSGVQYQQFMPHIYFRTDLNKRLQTSGFYSDNGQVSYYYMSKSYNYNDGHNNGNVLSITNNNDNNRSQTFTYDPLNRITAGWSQASAGTYSWGENYSIDAWGNLQISPMAGKAHGGNFQKSGDVNNRATGLGYDAAGNLTNYTAPGQYVYDPENRIQSTAGMTYTYDADGERVLKSQTSNGIPVKRYWSAGGSILAEGDGAGNLTSEYVYFGGKRTARIDLPANTVHYYLSDHLNSTSQVVSSSGVIEEESDYSPFGTEVVVTGTGPNHYKFTGKERDPESGLDYFGARYYSNGLGRFITPDWAAKATAVPYADFADPQSLNLYTYVRNIPTTKYDADGHKDLPLRLPPPPPPSAFVQKLGNLLGGHGWKTDAQVAAKGAQDRADWDKAQQSVPKGLRMPYPDIKIGIAQPGGGVVGAAAKAAVLADEALVVRGGLNQAENFANGKGVTIDAAGNLQGVSVNSANGATVEQLSQGVKNGQVGVSTVGEVRAAGGEVTPSPTAPNPNHCTMCGVTPQKAQELFTPTIPNPSKPQ